jgi:small subunit ribosomal protein S20
LATHAQAEKRARQNDKRRERNRLHKTAMRTAIRKLRKAIETGDKSEAGKLLEAAVSRISRTASRGAIHANKAARTVSRLTRAFFKMQ